LKGTKPFSANTGFRGVFLPVPGDLSLGSPEETQKKENRQKKARRRQGGEEDFSLEQLFHGFSIRERNDSLFLPVRLVFLCFLEGRFIDVRFCELLLLQGKSEV